MKKYVALIMLIGCLLNINMNLTFADEITQAKDLQEAIELSENEVVNLNADWVLVDDFWIKPDHMGQSSDYVVKSIPELSLAGSVADKDRVRGTLYKTFKISESMINTPLVIYNTIFNDNFEIFINGKALEKANLRIRYRGIENGYIFVPVQEEITIVIHFDQDTEVISPQDGIFLGTLKTYENKQRLVWFVESIMASLTLVFLVYLIWQRLVKKFKSEKIIFELLVVSFLLKFLLPEVNVVNIGTNYYFFRFHVFLYAFITTIFLTYGFRGKKAVVSYIREFSVVYLLLFAVIITITPLNLVKNIAAFHLFLVFIYLVWCNLYKLQLKALIMFGYYLLITILNWYGILNSNIFMLPVILVLIYISFNRELISDEKPIENDMMNVKEVIGNDRADLQCREMLQVLDEGFILLTSDLYIDHGYSEVVKSYFDFEIKHKKITDILYPSDFDSKIYAETILGRFFEAETETDKRLYLDLLTSKIVLNDHVINVKYKMTKDDRFIAVLLKDQTLFQEQLDEKQSIQIKLEMILEIIKNQAEFKQLYQMYFNFTKYEIEALIEKSSTLNQYLDMLLEKLNYFEKQFDLFRLSNAVEKINQIITELNNLKKEGSFSSYSDILKYLEILELENLLAVDLEMLEGALNENVMKHENIVLIEQSDFVELEKQLNQLPGSESLIELVSKMKFSQNQKLIRQYDQYISELARRNGKKIKPIKIIGYEYVVNNQAFGGILKSMMHLIDNSILHGIEIPSERFRKNKSEFGSLEVIFDHKTTYVEMIFSDDGKGVDYNRIKDMLYQQQRVPFETLVLLNPDSLSDYLLEEGVTSDTEHYKGLGLSLLKKEVDLQDGNIRIESALNQFTRIIIKIPDKTYR